MTYLPRAVEFEGRVLEWFRTLRGPAHLHPFNPAPGWGRRFLNGSITEALRPPASLADIRNWERRYGYVLPGSLRDWLMISNGLNGHDGPLVHPLTAIGPMIPFARVPNLLVQPESWFELGNPGCETVCIDLGYRWPGGDFPIFASGDDELGTCPRIVATGFGDWLGRLLQGGGEAYWLEPEFPTLGDPWELHRRYVPVPHLPDHLRPLAHRVAPLLGDEADERAIARELGISTPDVEILIRYIQHSPAGPGPRREASG
ncbi:MAG: SMI1/KNR4 family protein [Isosphaeraceae bacterium]